MSIFKNGCLNPECINQNYRGRPGWPCTFDLVKGRETEHSVLLGISLAAVVNESPIFSGGESLTESTTGISQFTPAGIPAGELVWKCGKDSFKWNLQCHKEIKIPINRYLERHPYIVPYLIAETAEDAERLKDWYK